MKRELEQALEARCVVKIEARGGLALKLAVPGVRGFPDRTVLMPGTTRSVKTPGRIDLDVTVTRPRIWFAEFKRLKTGRVSAQQHRWRVLLHQLGFGVYMIDTDEQFDAALEKELER